MIQLCQIKDLWFMICYPRGCPCSSQMPADDVIRTQEIASLQIHVERAINKIENF